MKDERGEMKGYRSDLRLAFARRPSRGVALIGAIL